MKKKRIKKKWIIILIAALSAFICIWLYKSSVGVSAEVLRVSKDTITEYVEDTAEVECKDVQTVFIEGHGKIIDISVDVGQYVEKGQQIADLDKSDLELKLRDAEAGISSAKAKLKGTEIANYADEISQAQIEVEQSKTVYESALRDYEKAKKLFESEGISRTEFEKAEEMYKTAKSNFDSAVLKLEELKKGTPEHVKEEYRILLEQALIGRDIIKKEIEKQHVEAPISGVVLEKFVDENAVVSSGTAGFVIGDTSDIQLKANILANGAVKIQIGNLVEISGETLQDKTIKGKVTKIDPKAREEISSLGVNQKRVYITIEFLEKVKALKPGYNVDVKIITSKRDNTLIVPDSCVFEYKGGDFVFTVENGKAKLREVQKGLENGDYIEILNGLSEGELVIVEPDNEIKEGTLIKLSSNN